MGSPSDRAGTTTPRWTWRCATSRTRAAPTRGATSWPRSPARRTRAPSSPTPTSRTTTRWRLSRTRWRPTRVATTRSPRTRASSPSAPPGRHAARSAGRATDAEPETDRRGHGGPDRGGHDQRDDRGRRGDRSLGTGRCGHARPRRLRLLPPARASRRRGSARGRADRRLVVPGEPLQRRGCRTARGPLMSDLIGKTVASVEVQEWAARDTFKDTVTWERTVLTFTDGTSTAFDGWDGEVFEPYRCV